MPLGPTTHAVDLSDPTIGRAGEWLVTNGLGGYASGTISGIPTRRYHGLLIAALPSPFGRVVMFAHLVERFRIGEPDSPARPATLIGFHLDMGLPRWRFAIGGTIVEKRLILPRGRNTVLLTYRLEAGSGLIRLELEPALRFRPHDGPLDPGPLPNYVASEVEAGLEVRSPDADHPPLRFRAIGDRASYRIEERPPLSLEYRIEAERGDDATGRLRCPCEIRFDLEPGGSVALIASTESWATIAAERPGEAERAEQERRRGLIDSADPRVRTGIGAELVLAADQFPIAPLGRPPDGSGEAPRTIIAGYHWFTDWGRDTMIALEGLTLATGRSTEARTILRTFSRAIREGLIPNLYPEGSDQGVYHTADATLWYFHALARYLRATDDRETLRLLLPKLLDVVDQHVRGTRFGIGIDPADGLLRQGAEGYQLTWMDAKFDGWVVTPRRGKAVELNALWYNALRLLEGWVRVERGQAAARPLAERAEQSRRSFNARFWSEAHGQLFDVVDGPDGDDPACRPNQVFAIALDHPILEPGRWESVLEVVRDRLLTPVGLRSLAPGHPDYHPRYEGDLRSRDAAYHQGTVWAWLIGPYVDAWLRVHPDDRAGARRLLEGFEAELGRAGIGTISEIFDAEPPFAPRGCVSQAWSVAEALRAWLRTTDETTMGTGPDSIPRDDRSRDADGVSRDV